MKVISFNTRLDNKRQAAFVIFYAPEPNPTCLMINRADKTIGFIGGMVEKGESLEQAVIREVEEEVGHRTTTNLQPIVAHDIGPITTHVFSAELTGSELRTVHDKASMGVHFGLELTGVFITRFTRNHTVDLLKTKMAPSVTEELIHFLLVKNIFNREELNIICQRANYSLDSLLR